MTFTLNERVTAATQEWQTREAANKKGAESQRAVYYRTTAPVDLVSVVDRPEDLPYGYNFITNKSLRALEGDNLVNELGRMLVPRYQALAVVQYAENDEGRRDLALVAIYGRPWAQFQDPQ